MSQANPEEERRRKLSEVANQDSALFKLLGEALSPYKRWMAVAAVLS